MCSVLACAEALCTGDQCESAEIDVVCDTDIYDEHWNLKDAMVIYGEITNYAGIIMDDEAKEPENSGSSCEDLYVRFAKAIRKEKRKDEHVRQAGYADAKEKEKCRACRQCSQNKHRCATGGRQCRNFERLLHNPKASHEASRYAFIRKDDGIQRETYILQDF